MQIAEIHSVPSWDTNTASEILAALTTPDPLPRANARYTLTGLKALFEDTVVAGWELRAEVRILALLASTEESARIQGVVLRQNFETLKLAPGPDFSLDKTQAAIESMRVLGIVTADEATALKALGVDSRTPWQRRHGDADPPTLAEVTTALEAAHTLAWLDARYPFAREQLLTGEISSQADVLAAIEGA